jgi:hypothetical protein
MRYGSRGRFVVHPCCTAHNFGRTSCLGTLQLCRTQMMQYENYVKNLVPDSNAEVLSHQQTFKT